MESIDWQFNGFDLENNQSAINDKQPRSPAIAIIRSNNRAPPQAEPFYRPKHLPTSNQQQQLATEPATENFVSHSLPTHTDTSATLSSKGTTSNTNEKKPRSQASTEHPEEPRTPHSRAKNVARFYPVTKDASVVTPEVSFHSSLRVESEWLIFLDSWSQT